MYWTQHNYAENYPGSVFLKTVTNPATGCVYDLWIVSTVGDGWSPTYHNGPEAHEYGSFPASQIDVFPVRREPDPRDTVFGLDSILEPAKRFLYQQGLRALPF